MTNIYTDYRFRFPVASLGVVLAHMPALRAWLRTGPGASFCAENMLGDRFDAAGNPAVVNPDGTDNAVFAGRQGGPGGGDPAMMYFHYRAIAPLGVIPFIPASIGLVVTTPAESAAVLGVWA